MKIHTGAQHGGGSGNSSNSNGKKKSVFLRLLLGVAAGLVICLQLYLFLFGVGRHGGDQSPALPIPVELVPNNTSRSDRSTTNLSQKTHPNATATVAYAISLIKCSDKQTNDAGLIDAALVLRHSIHKISIRSTTKSQYDYRMYALVHPQAQACSKVLGTAGFQVVVVDSPVQPHEIQGAYLRNNIELEWCCGSAEFIKLYAYTLPEPVVVHVDIDFVFLQPMDDLFDAILHPKDSVKGQVARSRIPLERPEDIAQLPDIIDAFITRDYPQIIPGRKALYQAGFLVAKRNPAVLQEAMRIIQEGIYKEGYELHNGWSGAGYGAFVGAMAMQGLMAYYYDIVKPNTAVELNQCRFNHMGMDVRYRHPPNFYKRKVKKVGKCRDNRKECEDCMITNVSLISSVHYTQCRKPWNCIGVGAEGGRVPGGKPATAIDTNAGNFDHCMQLIGKWHELRLDLERSIFGLTQDKAIFNARGSYNEDIFFGHCSGEGGANYTRIQGLPGTLEVMEMLYSTMQY